jgi:hypothetical protein
VGKHKNKIEKALEARIKNTPNQPGFKTPGSRNKKKTGYS